MHDKDFDQLFKQRFDAFEVEPSAGSWQKIAKALDAPTQRKKTFPSYWMAAASFIILVSVALWLYKPVEVIQLRGKSQGQVAVSESKQPDKDTLADKIIIDEPVNTGKFRPDQLPKVGIVVAHKSDKVNNEYSEKKTLPSNIRKEDAQENNVVLAKQTVKNPLNNAETTLAAENKQLPLALVEEDVIDNYTGEEETKKPRIKSIGGLVNFVIAQVDKREDKIIEFKDGEEGSEVSGINLGPLKFKSRNK